MAITSYALMLQKIQLRNFRAFTDVSLTFHPRLTILIGENGAGKSTVLDSIAGSLLLYVEKLCSRYTDDSTLLKSVFKTNDIQYGQKQSLISLNTILDFESISFKKPNDDGDTEETQETEDAELLLDGAERVDMVREINWTTYLTPKNYKITDFEGLEDLNKFVQTINFRLRSSESGDVNLPLVAYYPLDRIDWAFQKIAPQALEVDIFNAFDDCLDTNKSLNFDLFVRWFKWQENLSRQTQNTTILDAVCNAIYTALNDDMQQPKYQSLYTDYTNPDLPDGDLHVFVNGNDVSVSQLSSGEKTILLLVADIARRLALANPHVEQPLAGQGIILIDEIDLHLHPRWQQKIVPQLLRTFPNCQFVVTTHSPMVISDYNISPEQVFLIGQSADMVDNKFVQIIVAIKELGLSNSGAEPNSIIEHIMRVSLRSEELRNNMQTLSKLLTIADFESDDAQKIIDEIRKRLSTNDPFILKLNHQLRLLAHQKNKPL